MRTITSIIIVVVSLVCLSLSTPIQRYGQQWRQRYVSAMNAAQQEPSTQLWSMSAGPDTHSEPELPASEPEQTDDAAQNPSKKDPCKPSRSSPTPTKPTPHDEQADDNDDDDDDHTVHTSKGRKDQGGPVYTNFFPIMFGGGAPGSGRSAGGDTGMQRIAIANSFSTGRKAVAMSTAEAFGARDQQRPNLEQRQYRQSLKNRYRL